MMIITRQDYIDRLTAAGVRLDRAVVLVDDFLRDSMDLDGLADYCEMMEGRCVAPR